MAGRPSGRAGQVADRPMRLLVTGGAGFIGSNFVITGGPAPDDHVVAYDVLTYAGNRPNLADVEDRITFIQGDICDLETATRTLATRRSTRWSLRRGVPQLFGCLDPALFFRTNVLGTQTMLEAARRHGSTASTTSRPARSTGPGPRHDEKFTEESPYRPRTPYNASKAGADHAVRAYGETFELPSPSQLLQTLGPFQFPRRSSPSLRPRPSDDKPLTLYASTENRRSGSTP